MTSNRLKRVGLVASHDDWQYTNPILASDEHGLESDTGIAKHGDDITPWNDLLPLPSTSILADPPWLYLLATPGTGVITGSTDLSWNTPGLGNVYGDPFCSVAGTLVSFTKTCTVVIEVTVYVAQHYLTPTASGSFFLAFQLNTPTYTINSHKPDSAFIPAAAYSVTTVLNISTTPIRVDSGSYFTVNLNYTPISGNIIWNGSPELRITQLA